MIVFVEEWNLIPFIVIKPVTSDVAYSLITNYQIFNKQSMWNGICLLTLGCFLKTL